MTSLSLREAAEQTGTSKSTIWRAIRAGKLSGPRNDDGGFAIDPAELFRAFPPQRLEQRSEGQDATPSRPPEHATGTVGPAATDELALQLAVANAELRGLKEMIAELKQARDAWQGQAERATMVLTGPKPERRPSPTWLPWRRRAG
jgi:excisionase family DNA binding protein